jgi:hypothetical protein
MAKRRVSALNDDRAMQDFIIIAAPPRPRRPAMKH